MGTDPNHIFWVKRWNAARRIHAPGMMTAVNQTLYLTYVFSFYFDQWTEARRTYGYLKDEPTRRELP